MNIIDYLKTTLKQSLELIREILENNKQNSTSMLTSEQLKELQDYVDSGMYEQDEGTLLPSHKKILEEKRKQKQKEQAYKIAEKMHRNLLLILKFFMYPKDMQTEIALAFWDLSRR